MGRSQKILLIVLALVACAVVYVALRNRQPPILPPDADHAVLDIPKCLDCHNPAGKYPRGRNHPVGDDCFRCHGHK